MDLPAFPYHPDPIASGSVIASGKTCKCCKQARGFIYAGPSYCEAELDESLCPWCIADGSAADCFDATFVDPGQIGDDASAEAVEQVSTRTPGYSAWQEEVWPACCGDATAFIGPFGFSELRRTCHEEEGAVVGHIVYNMKVSGRAAINLLESLNRDHGPTLFMFRCRKCSKSHFHIDSH